MKKRLIVAWLAVLVLTPFGWATSNLNLSKSNINRYLVVYPTNLVTDAKAETMLNAIDKIAPADEAKLKQWLKANFEQYGIDGSRVKKVVILAPIKKVPQIGIILLTDPTDEPRATALARHVTSSKSNSSD
jgi:hypothetical protein